MNWDTNINPEDEDETIRKIAEKLHNYGMEIPAIMFLETIKPLSRIGSMLGRIFISPFLPFFGDDIDDTGEKLLQLFEKRENIEKFLKYLEKFSRNGEFKKY